MAYLVNSFLSDVTSVTCFDDIKIFKIFIYFSFLDVNANAEILTSKTIAPPTTTSQTFPTPTYPPIKPVPTTASEASVTPIIPVTK